MRKTYQAAILSREKTLYEGEIYSAIVPAGLGYAGILANHAPFISILTAGKIILREKSGNSLTFTNKAKGFIEMSGNRLTILYA